MLYKGKGYRIAGAYFSKENKNRAWVRINRLGYNLKGFTIEVESPRRHELTDNSQTLYLERPVLATFHIKGYWKDGKRSHPIHDAFTIKEMDGQLTVERLTFREPEESLSW